MVNSTQMSTQLPVGSADMSALRRAAKENSPEAIKAVAQQFEALLLNMMMKSMREATPKGGLFDSEQSRLYMSLLDQQVSQNFAKRGMGLADALVRQMSTVNGQTLTLDKLSENASPENVKQAVGDAIKLQQASLLSSLTATRTNDDTAAGGISQWLGMSATDPNVANADKSRKTLEELIAQKQTLITSARSSDGAQAVSPGASRSAHVQAFQQKFAAAAESVSSESGIPAKFMLGQAALETGWGKNVMVCADGTSSHNLFGIKANAGWKGKVVESVTTEYVNGVAYKQTEKFRAYDSYEDSFRDYANFLQSNPRYKHVLASGQDARQFAQNLQRAGYATDPQYASKLTRIIQKTLSG